MRKAGKADLLAALEALRQGETGPWEALAPLMRLQAAGTEIRVDFSAAARLGAPLILARPAANRLEALTPRQAEVARLMARGASNKAIARDPGLSPATV